MSKTNDGGPAFPNAEPMWDSATNTYTRHIVKGMTLRDWFAGQALASFDERVHFTEQVAEKAYRYADAMLAERMREPRPQPEEPKLNYVN